MNESVLSWILIVEFVLPFFILSVILLLILMKNKSRYKKAMRQLIIGVKEGEPVQLESIQSFLNERLGYDEGEVDKVSKSLMKERKFFFRSLVSSVLNKDVEGLAALDDELTRLTDRYHSLQVQGGTVEAVEAESVAETDDASDGNALQSELESKQAKIEELKMEKKELQQEVHKTLTTLNNIFAEYSSMFGEEIERKNMTVEQILTAMESFSGGKKEAVGGGNDSAVEPDVMPEPVAEPEIEAEPAAASESESDISALDDMPLESISDDEEPNWDDAFAESGDEVDSDQP